MILSTMLPRNVPFIFIPKTLAGDLLLDSGKSSEAADPDRLRPPGSRQVRDIRELFNEQWKDTLNSAKL